MIDLVSKLSTLWKLAVAQLRTVFMIPDPEPRDYPFVHSDVAQLQRLCRGPDTPSLDDATWKDMLLDAYRAELSGEVSIFGQHILYQRLRDGSGGADPERVKGLFADPARTQQLHQLFTCLRDAEKEIVTLLYEDKAPSIPWWAGKTWPLPAALIASAVAMVWVPLAAFAAVPVLYVLMSTQMRYHERVERWECSMHSLQLLLRVVSLLEGPHAAAAGKINRGLTRSPVIHLPAARPYLDWFALENVNHYFKGVRLVHANLGLLRDCFTQVAKLEADVALARHLSRVPRFCWAEHSLGATIDLRATIHPLLSEAQPLTIALEGGGAFISGQNGVGKSTLLRTLGINLIAARAFGFCYAQHASVPMLPVYASMQSEDSLLGGESLYMAELRRAREMLAAASGRHPGIYIIDEIFRGTNHLESVSAAASVLDALAARGLVVVSSHNLVLASLLAHRLIPLCVTRDGNGSLTLANGVLAQTNGISLLAQGGFGTAVETNAGRVFTWLSAYLAQPIDCADVLA